MCVVLFVFVCLFFFEGVSFFFDHLGFFFVMGRGRGEDIGREGVSSVAKK